MQATTPEEKGKLVKLTELADNINNEFRNSNQLAVDAIKGGQAAVKAAIRAGEHLTRAKRTVGHGKWLKWLADNCPDISDETARKWMALANSNIGRNLSAAKNVTSAYKSIGIIPEDEVEKKGIGTAPVDIFAELLKRFNRRLDSVIEITADVNPEDMPHDKRVELLTKAQPMLTFCERVKQVEGV